MSAAKAEILARLRSALEVPGRGAGAVPRAYRGALAGTVAAAEGPAGRGAAARPEDLDLLVERLIDYQAKVRRTDQAGLPATVGAALAERGVRRLLVPAGLPAGWLAGVATDGVRESGGAGGGGALPAVGSGTAYSTALVFDEPPLGARALDTTDGVITGCAVAVAATGTIVLDAGPGQGRRALSLVPDYHLCVVAADQVVAGVPAAVARLDPTRPQTWISGPSATSDIEFNRVEGVHGPRTLEVIVVS